MAAFDLQSMYFVKNNAPFTSKFEDIMGEGEKGFNLGKAYKAQYDKNSLQNLIAQREKEGVPYYMLGNEAAKWDLDAARGMDKDRIGMIKDQYTMDKDRFTEWRQNMARRIGAKILQIAQATQIPEEQYYQVLRTAASYVMTYDPTLAQWLLAQANSRVGTQEKNARKAKSISKDDHVTMSKEKNAFYDFAKGAEGTQDQRDIAAAEYDRLQMLEAYLGGRYPIYTWMTGYLRGVHNAGGTYEDAIRNIVNNYNPDEEPGFEYRSLAGANAPEPDAGLEDLKTFMGISKNAAPKGKGAVPKASAGSTGDVSESGYTGLQSDGNYSYIKLKHNALGGYNAPEDHAMASMANDLNNADSVAQLTKIIGAIEEYETIPGAKSVESLKKHADELMKGLSEMEAEVGENPTAHLVWKNIPARSRGADIRRFRQAGTFASGIVSTTPLSIVDNGLMVQSPDYVISSEMKKSSEMLDTDEGFTTFMNLLGQSGNELFNKYAAKKTAYDVVASIGNDVLNTMRPIYTTILKKCKNDAQRQEVKDFLSEYYGWPKELFYALEDKDGSLGTAEELRKRAHAINKSPKNQYIQGKKIDKNGNVTDIEDSEASADDIEI